MHTNPDEPALRPLIEAGESHTLEFKTSFDKAVVESLVAFANARGGTVLVGVTDAGRIKGVTLGKETLNEWLGQIKSANYRSSLRNKLVAEGFYLTGNIEKYGSGFIRIRKALRAYPEVEFEVREFAGGVMATFTQLQGASIAGQVTGQVTHEIACLVGVMRGDMSRQELQTALALKSRENFDKRYLKPAIAQGLLQLSIPDKPTSRLQKYRLTPTGKMLRLQQQEPQP